LEAGRLMNPYGVPPELRLVPVRTAVHWGATIVPAIVLLVAVAFGIREWRRTGRPLLLVVLAGGALCTLIEPVIDAVGQVYLREANATIVYRLAGRGMPIWVPPFWAVFAGLQTYLFCNLLRSRPDRRRYWTVVLTVFSIALVLELPSTALGLYEYFGHQPFNPTGMPLWWLFTYLGGLGAAALIVGRPELFSGPRILLAVPLVPSAIAAWMAATGWPTFLALQSGAGLFVTYPAAVMTAGLSVLGVSLVAKGFATAETQLDATDGSAGRTGPAPADATPATAALSPR
jgi:hypothetical protein